MATAKVRAATVCWVPGATNGSLPTSFTVTASPGGTSTIVSGTRSSATVTGLTVGTSYSFTVRATNAVGTSVSSSRSTAVVARGDVPTTPAGLRATTAADQVTLTWTAASRAPTTYRIYRCASETSTSCTMTTSALASVSAGTLRYVDTSVVGGMHYRYVVVAANRWGASARSTAVRATPPVTHLAAPTLTVRSGASRVTVSWKGVLGAERYEVLRCAGTCLPSGEPVAAVSAPGTSFTHRAAPGASYSYAVRAVTGGVVSPLSTARSGTAAARAPGVLAAMNHYSVKRRATVTLSGRVNVAYAGERVVRQYWTGRSWHTITSAVVAADGSYRFTIHPTVRSRTTYRVVLPATATHMTGVSRHLRLTVR
jgi:hypothetical protein